MSDIVPSQTLYINNLNEKIKRAPLKKALYQAFSQFGRIVEIVNCRGDSLRGQAWICFENVDAATNAMAQFQGHPFFDKPIRIAFAKSKSDIVAKKDGTFKPRETKPKKVVEKPQKAVPMDTSAAPSAPITNMQETAPSSILFAQNLPNDCTDAALAMLFTVHNGFKEVRMVPGKAGIAFIEFENEFQATTALQSLNGFKLTPTDFMALSYSKK